MPPVKRNMETMKKKDVSKYHYNWSSRSPEIVVIELHREHTDCHDCILSSVCDQKIKKITELQTFIEKNKNIVCKLLAVRHGIATYKYISQGRRGTQLLDPCNSSLIAPKGEKGVNQATSRLSDRDIPSSPDNYESISSMFRLSFFWGGLFDNTRRVSVRCRSQLFSETRVLYS